jgi:hypothetical protein
MMEINSSKLPQKTSVVCRFDMSVVEFSITTFVHGFILERTDRSHGTAAILTISITFTTKCELAALIEKDICYKHFKSDLDKMISGLR